MCLIQVINVNRKFLQPLSDQVCDPVFGNSLAVFRSDELSHTREVVIIIKRKPRAACPVAREIVPQWEVARAGTSADEGRTLFSVDAEEQRFPLVIVPFEAWIECSEVFG